MRMMDQHLIQIQIFLVIECIPTKKPMNVCDLQPLCNVAIEQTDFIRSILKFTTMIEIYAKYGVKNDFIGDIMDVCKSRSESRIS